MAQKFSLPRGTSDVLPTQISRWNQIEKASKEVLRSFNYKEIRTPIFEEMDLFARSMGQTSDVVQKQMLNLASQRSDEQGNLQLSGFSLRPENTASVVRCYIENSLDRKETLSKLFYIGPMFRGERPQKGRLRQFHQLGVEAIGPNTSSPYLDAEVIALAVQVLKACGLSAFIVKVNTLGSPEDKENFSISLRDQLKDKMDKLCPDCQNRFERNVFRILDCKVQGCKDAVKSLELDHSYLSDESAKYYQEVKKALISLNVSFEETLNLVRGLDYYTHTVFEIVGTSLGSQDALGAGGRYNRLVSQLGGSPDVDAVGFALGMERILIALGDDKKEEKEQLDVFTVALDEKSFPRAWQLMQMIREQGLSCDMTYKVSSMKSQMRAANKAGARYVMIMGEDEMSRDIVTLKNMESSEQKEISQKDICHLKEIIK